MRYIWNKDRNEEEIADGDCAGRGDMAADMTGVDFSLERDGIVSFRASPPVLSTLKIASGSLHIASIKPPPCRWWRFWQWALLGWRWVDLREVDTA